MKLGPLATGKTFRAREDLLATTLHGSISLGQTHYSRDIEKLGNEKQQNKDFRTRQTTFVDGSDRTLKALWFPLSSIGETILGTSHHFERRIV